MRLYKKHNTLNMSHEEWLECRRQGIGGSDAGALCGVNPYASPVTVYLDKTGQSAEKEDTTQMRVGRKLETAVADFFCEDTDKKVKRQNAIFYHPEHPFMLANVDRLVIGENAGLECKTTSSYGAEKWKDGKIPESYEIQCHHYMAVTGADRWYISCLVGNSQIIHRTIERDEEIIRDLIRIEEDFWNNYVLAGVTPPPDGSAASEDIIKQRYPESNSDLLLDLPDGLEKQLIRVKEIDALAEKLKAEKDEICQTVKEFMGEAEKAVGTRLNVTWKTQQQNRVDTAALKKKHPNIWEECSKVTSYRRFIIKEM